MKYCKSILALFFIGLVYCYSVFQYKPYKDLYLVQEGDACGYYMYLPSFFIHHDLANLYETLTAHYRHCAPERKAEPHSINKYFMGTAVLQAPFFGIAHLLARPLGYERDGYSMIYMYAIQLSCDVYVILGLLILILILRRRFSDSVTAIVILLIALATNLYYLSVYHAPFSHPYLFFWYSALIFFTVRLYESLQPRYILLIGFLCGMITLTRLTESYAVLIPLLWGISGTSDVKSRFKLLWSFRLSLLAAGFIMFSCLIPQMLYWKAASGHFLYYSYQGESFDFLHPHIWDGLFSGMNGWLAYSPIMILAILGIVFAARRRDASFAAMVVFIPLHCYIIYSWWCWFYMGSYGSRPMTEAYPLLSISLAFTVEWFWTTIPKKIILLIILSLCVFQVLLQTYQTHIGIFNSEMSNWPYNVVTFGKTRISYEESVVLNSGEFQPTHPILIKTLYTDDFEGSRIEGSDSSVATSGHCCVRLGLNKNMMIYAASLRDMGASPGQWIKASVNCLAKDRTDNLWHLSNMVITFRHGGETTKWRRVGLQNKMDNPRHLIRHFSLNKWGRVYFYSQIPKDAADTDTVMVYMDHTDGPDVYLDDAAVDLYEEK